jgi:hypothetical protein
LPSRSSLRLFSRIPLVYKPVDDKTKAILPIVTHHASNNGIHHLEILHLDVTASMIRMADGHYELVSPHGADEVTRAALAEDRWFYSPNPSIEINTERKIVDTNLMCRVLLEATDCSLHDQPVEFLLGKLSLDGDELPDPKTEFNLDSVKAVFHRLEYSSPAFGKISCRGMARIKINLVGDLVGMSWDWAIKEIERDTNFRKAFREQLAAALKWDVYAANYDRVLPLCDYYSEAVTRHVSHLAPPQAEGIEKVWKVCDIGAGTGNVSLQLLEQGCQVTAVDLSRSMLRHLQAKTATDYASRLKILQQSAE